jgi:3-oxoacyl-[acyl-carrier-protein] synthase-1
MIYCLADNVVSPLGMTTAENYLAVKNGQTALCRYEHHWSLPEAFTASLFSDEQNQLFAIDGLTRFESLAVRSAQDAIGRSGIDVASQRVVFILSSTKGNIELLSHHPSSIIHQTSTLGMGTAARRIARHLGFTTEPIVVCNACISGVSAIMLAQRLLEADVYDYAVVCGADVQNKFTVSGFQSLKAISEEACRPFDMERLGLNLGEAAATMVFSHSQPSTVSPCWAVCRSSVYNDAYHISAPSKDGEGARLALAQVLEGTEISEVGFVNAHGTATMYNDQMESKAIERAGLNSVPVNALKGYFGHTLGAAGVLETVISMAAADDHTILATKGFEELGVSGKIQVTSTSLNTDKHCFVKMISGFGGCNGALLLKRDAASSPSRRHLDALETAPRALRVGTSIKVTPETPLTLLYKEHIGDYPKYYKMDGLSRLGFVASELLLHGDGKNAPNHQEKRTAVILFNRSSSIDADRKYQASIADDDFFPSPSVFVYTLPNIVTGEIAIRHQWREETSFYILPERNDALMQQIAQASLAANGAEQVLTGWIDYEDENNYECELTIWKN